MYVKRREMIRLGGGAAISCLLSPPLRASGVCVLTGPAFGSAWRLVLPETDEQPRLVIEEIVQRIDAEMSPFRQDSEVARFNGGLPVQLSVGTRAVVEVALSLAHDSDGAFDPTAAPFGRRYGFGPLSISPTAPAGHHRELRLNGDRLLSATKGLTVDLNGVAKGHALDLMIAALSGLDFVLELGGEVAARGRHPSGRPWQLGIERPGSDKLQRLIDAERRVLATSGDESQSYVSGGRRYGHVVDPRSGAPIESGVASVSVLAATGLLADGLATAALVLGPDESRELLARHDASALFLMRTRRGLAEVELGGFDSGVSR